MFETIFDFRVHDELMNGTQVMCHDKQTGKVYDLLKLTVDEYTQILRAAADDKENRYMFYYWKEAEA